MLEITTHPRIVMIKMSTRDMAHWLYGFEQLKTFRPELSITTCHDEFLLPTLLESADGAHVGFAEFAPRLIVRMVCAALDGDLHQVKPAQQHVAH